MTRLKDMSRAELEERIESLEYGLAELEHRLPEDSEEWEVIQDCIAPGYLTVNKPSDSDELDNMVMDILPDFD